MTFGDAKLIIPTGLLLDNNNILQNSKFYNSRNKLLFILNVFNAKQFLLYIKPSISSMFLKDIYLNDVRVGVLYNDTLHSIEIENIKYNTDDIVFDLLLINNTVHQSVHTIVSAFKIYLNPSYITLYRHDVQSVQVTNIADKDIQCIKIPYMRDFVQYSRALMLDIMKENIK